MAVVVEIGDTMDGAGSPATGTARVKRGMAEMLKGGVIMDVVTAEQARIAEGGWPRCHGGWARRWSASTSNRSPSRTGSPNAAGKTPHDRSTL